MTPPLDLVRRFGDLHALVIGDVMLDSYLEGTASRLCAEGPVPVVNKTVEERTPGGAANTAANLRALGARRVSLLGMIGADASGNHLRAALDQAGVDTSCLVEDDAVSTLHKLRILADSQYVVRFDEGDTRNCPLEVHDRLLANLERAFVECDVVVVSDYDYGVLSETLLARLSELRRSRPSVLLVDSKNLPRYRSVNATVLTPNHLEARAAVGWSGGKEQGVSLPDEEETGRRLLAMTGAEHVAVTMGAEGVLLVGRTDQALHLPAHPVSQPKDVGAGDSFVAAMGLALAAGGDVTEAARIGIDAASVAVTKQRTAVVTHQELLQAVGTRLQSKEEGYPHLAVQAVEDARNAGHRIVFTNGVFDILHAGHVNFLRRAKALGDVLVVGVNTDRGARRLKGAGRPVNSERDRVALVAALDSVDHAVLFDEDTPAELIRTLRPHVHVKGGDYADGPLPEAEAVEEVGGEVAILPLLDGHSTSDVIDRIAALASRNLQESPL
ncbi:MAG: D-glycero-beta-D-manno-heptose 1-phosphate adenylyltransferase [Chloroflexota bacterium]|nr:D-glycero-beta-D-manno-heptose 1-phosphate adenylyltransferase [Chloroflexota bacterium]